MRPPPDYLASTFFHVRTGAPPSYGFTGTVAIHDVDLNTPVTIATDGAGGACGVCFPTTRTTNSYTWGTADSPLCPGFAMNDGDCNVEFLSVAAMYTVIRVEDGSWGAIKGLYR